MNSSEYSLPRLYSQEDIQQILNIALAQHSRSEVELSSAQILEIAEELQILPETLKLAENKWLTQQEVNKKRQEFDEYRRSKLQVRSSRYVIINTCLVALNVLAGFSVPWSLYVLICWGMVRGLDTWRFFYSPQSQGYERGFQKWERKEIHKLTEK